MNCNQFDEIVALSKSNGTVRFSLLATAAALEYMREKGMRVTIPAVKRLTGFDDDSWVEKCVEILDKLFKVDQSWSDLEAAIEQIFIEHKGDAYWNYPRERKAIKELVKMFDSYEDKKGAANRICETFYQLTSSQDKFWSKQPFLPSTLIAQGIFSRVAVETGKKADGGGKIIKFQVGGY